MIFRYLNFRPECKKMPEIMRFLRDFAKMSAGSEPLSWEIGLIKLFWGLATFVTFWI